MKRRPMCLLCLLLMAALCLSDWLGFSLIRGNPLPKPVQAWITQHSRATICGEVQRCVETEQSQSVYLKQVYLIYQSEKISIENVRIFLKEKETVPAGTLLLVSGKLEEVGKPRNPGEFDSRQYYACQHIYYFMKKAKIMKRSNSYSGYQQFLIDTRARFSSIFEEAAKEAAPVFCAIVLGDKTNLDQETKLRYQMAGIIHILAISGLHISILGMGFYQLLKKAGLGIWPAGILSLAFMLQYGMMTGGSVSTMRALCMFLLSVGAKILGRIYDRLTALALAAILILLDTPAWLYSGSFLLSFGAVLGLLVVVPVAEEITGVKKKPVKAFLSSGVVQLVMLPILLWFYGEVSLAGILLNLVILPTVGIVLVSGIGTALLGIFWIGGAGLTAFPGRGFLYLYEKLCELVGELPFCTWIGGQPEAWQILCYYGVLGITGIVGHRGRIWLDERNGEKCVKGSRRQAKTLKSEIFKGCIFLNLGCLGMVGIGVVILGFHLPHGLRITCLDVGQGDAIVVETPKGGCFLMDGGSSNKSSVGQYQLLPFLKSQGISYLDAIFVSHTDNDHINGIQQLLEFMGKKLTTIRAGTLVLPKWETKPEAYEELEVLAKEAGMKIFYAKERGRITTGGIHLTMLAPEIGATGADINEEGMVMQLDYGNFTALFTGDMGEETEKKLLDKLEAVEFLKVGHHGSKYSSCAEFLNRILPEVGVISCSSTNTYGHPARDTILRLEDVGCQLEYTMKNGAITVESDGEGMTVHKYLTDEKK